MHATRRNLILISTYSSTPASDERFGFLNYMDAFEEIRRAVGGEVEIGYSTRDGLSRYVRADVEQEAIRIF